MNMSSRHRAGRQRCSARRSGAAAVEFAVIAPVLFTLIFGIIEFSRVLMVQHTLVDASRDAAREASLATMKSVETVEANCRSRIQASIPVAAEGNTVSITTTPTDLTTASTGDPVHVRVTVSYSDVSWLPAIGYRSLAANTVLSAEATMERE